VAARGGGGAVVVAVVVVDAEERRQVPLDRPQAIVDESRRVTERERGFLLPKLGK